MRRHKSLGLRGYCFCLAYDDLNDHVRLRNDPMLAVAVETADPLRAHRRQARDRGKTLVDEFTLNRLKLTGSGVGRQ